MAVKKDIEIFRGASYNLVDTITGQNITGWSVSFIVRPKGSQYGENVINKSVGSGITLTTPASGILTISFSDTDTDIETGMYDYTVARTDDGYESVLTYGNFRVMRNTVLGDQSIL